MAWQAFSRLPCSATPTSSATVRSASAAPPGWRIVHCGWMLT
jgi:hypothetical protein